MEAIFRSLRATRGSGPTQIRSCLSAQPNSFKELYSSLSTFQSKRCPRFTNRPGEMPAQHQPAIRIRIWGRACTLQRERFTLQPNIRISRHSFLISTSVSYRCPLSVSCHCTAMLHVTRYPTRICRCSVAYEVNCCWSVAYTVNYCCYLVTDSCCLFHGAMPVVCDIDK